MEVIKMKIAQLNYCYIFRVGYISQYLIGKTNLSKFDG